LSHIPFVRETFMASNSLFPWGYALVLQTAVCFLDAADYF